MSYQCQNAQCMRVTPKAVVTCLSDLMGAYFVCSSCEQKTYLSQLAQCDAYAYSTFDRRTGS